MKTQQQALAWAAGGWNSSKYVKTINGRLGIDTDGYYGFQCKDFVNAYLDYVAGWIPGGNAIDLLTCDLPEDVTRIMNSASFIPQPGDVFIFGKPYALDGNGNSLGHTGVITSANATNFQSVDQNWFNASLTVGSPPAAITHNYNGFLGVLRPAFGEDDMSTVDGGLLRVLSYSVLGDNGLGLGGNRPNAATGELDSNLNKEVGAETNKKIWEYWNSPQAVEYRNKELPAIYDLARQALAYKQQLEQLEASGAIDAKGQALLKAIKEYLGN